MDLFAYLREYGEDEKRFLREFWDQERVKTGVFEVAAAGVNPGEEMVNTFEEFTGGKRVRGALVRLGCLCAGGKRQSVMPACAAVGIWHHFLLIHDDIMDRDEVRHGVETRHVKWTEIGTKWEARDPKHYGLSMAITLGDLGAFWGMRLMTMCEVEGERIIRAMRRAAEVLELTGYGQALDVTLAELDEVTEKELLLMYEGKSGWYTIAGPLQLGGILGGGSEDMIAAMGRYGAAVGTAFQLRDDILGMFGDEEKIGKGVGSDLLEGKHTLLFAKTMELASGKDAEFVRGMCGKKDLQTGDWEKVQEIMRECGALGYVEEMGKRLVNKGKKEIEVITSDAVWQRVLEELADFVIRRES